MLKLMHDNNGFLSWMPKMEQTTFDVSLVHFNLMFGYKLFSLFYPLYLASVGISLMNIGNIYFLTYFIISVSCFVINIYIRRINPAILASLGILGYGIFALMMLLSRDITVFYLAQVVLGVSAAAWLVSLKFILMNARSENQASSFGWFYAMPSYATAIAPAVGGAIIWKFGFPGVFFMSVVIQFLNAIYAYVRLGKNADVLGFKRHREDPRLESVSQLRRYRRIIGLLNGRKNVLVILAFIFGTLVLGGIYRTFFVLVLRDMSYSQEEIIRFTSAISFIYVPFSLLVIKLMGRFHKAKIVSGGMVMEGITAVVLGTFYSALSVGALFVVYIVDSMGALALGSGKSAYFAKKLDAFKEEASTIDSIMTTLGPALGGLLGGIAVSAWGYQRTFLAAGAVVAAAGLYSYFLNFDERGNGGSRGTV